MAHHERPAPAAKFTMLAVVFATGFVHLAHVSGQIFVQREGGVALQARDPRLAGAASHLMLREAVPLELLRALVTLNVHVAIAHVAAQIGLLAAHVVAVLAAIALVLLKVLAGVLARAVALQVGVVGGDEVAEVAAYGCILAADTPVVVVVGVPEAARAGWTGALLVLLAHVHAHLRLVRGREAADVAIRREFRLVRQVLVVLALHVVLEVPALLGAIVTLRALVLGQSLAAALLMRREVEELDAVVTLGTLDIHVLELHVSAKLGLVVVGSSAVVALVFIVFLKVIREMASLYVALHVSQVRRVVAAKRTLVNLVTGGCRIDVVGCFTDVETFGHQIEAHLFHYTMLPLHVIFQVPMVLCTIIAI